MDDSVTEPLAMDDHASSRSAGQRVHQGLLVLAMFLGSLAMWAGSPALWLYLAGRFSKVSTSSMGTFLMVIIGIPVTMVLIGKVLARLDAVYTERFGRTQNTRNSAARWLHSARGGSQEEPPSMLDKVLVVAVAMAMITTSVWYVFLSHGSQAPH
jgi:hypothetical protein